MNTNWTQINPTLIPINDFIVISNGPGRGRTVTQVREDKAEESFQLIGPVPRIIHLAHTDMYNPVGVTGLKYAILDGAAAFMNSLFRGRDPRDDNFEFWVAPDEKTNPHDLALIRVKMNRAVTVQPLLSVIVDYATTGMTHYQDLLTVMQRFPEISPIEAAICLNPNGGLTARAQGIENGTFTVTNLGRGTEAANFLHMLHLDLRNQNRVDFIKRNGPFVQEMTLRFMAGTFHIDYSGYPGILPGPQTGPKILGDGNPPILTTRNTIKFKKIQCDVIAQDDDFPKKPFTHRTSVKMDWNMRILDDMAIPRHP